MIDDSNTIRKILAEARNIYSLEGDQRIMLVYDHNKLVRISDFGLVFKSIRDVERITFNYDLDAWQVIWKV